MFEGLKNKIALFYLNRKLKSMNGSALPFNNFWDEARDVLVIYPEKEEEIKAASGFTGFLISEGKKTSVIMDEVWFNSFRHRDAAQVIAKTAEDVNRLGLPSESFISKLTAKEYDVLLDLSLTENIYSKAAAVFARARYKAGFSLPGNEKYLNFLVNPSKTNPEESYKKLKETVKMF